jgi:hypothetical protein
MEENVQKVDGGIILEWRFKILKYANTIHTNLQFKVTEYKIFFWIYSTTLSETFLTLRRNERGTIKNVYGFSRKLAVIVLRF